MKPTPKLLAFLYRRPFAGLCLMPLMAALIAGSAQASTFYWDNNNTASGFGTAGAGGATWAQNSTTPATGTNSARWKTDSEGLLAGSATQSTTNSDIFNFGTSTLGLGAGTITVSGTVTMGDTNYGSASGAIVLSSGTINFGAAKTITVNNTTNTINSNIIGASTSLTKAGAGTLVFGGANTYTGTTIVSGGGLTVASTGSINVGTSTTTGTLSVTGGSEFRVDGGSATFRGSGSGDNNGIVLGNTTTAGNISVQNGGSLSLSNGRLQIGAGTSTSASNSGPLSTFTQTGGTTTINGLSFIGNVMPSTMSISGGIFSSGATSIGARADTTLNISGANTAVTLGTLTFGNSGADSTVAAGTDVTVNLNGGTLAVPSIAVSGAIANRTHTFNFDGGTLKATGASTSFFSTGTNLTASVKAGGGAIDNGDNNITIGQDLLTGGGSDGGMTFKGNATTTLTGNSTYTGSTTVTAGTLLINGSLGNTAVTVDPLAAIGGTGSIGGSLSFGANSSLRVANFADPLAVGGTISFGSGFGIDNLLGIDWDSLDLNTPYTILAKNQDFSLAGLDNFGLANAVAVGNTGRQAYFTNGSLAVVVIPEPRAALLGGLGLLVLLRRRRA